MKRSLAAVLTCVAIAFALVGGTWIATYAAPAFAQEDVTPDETYTASSVDEITNVLEQIAETARRARRSPPTRRAWYSLTCR